MTKLPRFSLAPLLAFAALVSDSASAQSPEAKIMPVGDSITRGTNDIDPTNENIPGGYRKELGIRLGNAGYAYDFVGNSTDNPFPGMDPEHNGYDDLRTDQILANLPTWLAVNPDVVLLHVGTNDILQDVPVSTAAANLSSIISAITTNAPGRRLFVATIIPITASWGGRTASYLNGNANSYNTQVRNLVQQSANQGRDVRLVDMNASIVLTNPNPSLNFFQPGDGLHPGQAGYNQMGAIWAGAVTASGSLFPPPPAGSPAAPSALSATVISGSRINVSWTDNSVNEQSFAVFRKTGTGGTWQQIATLGQNATIFSVTDLPAAGNTYFFAVRGTNAAGNSGWSNIASSVPVNRALGKPASASSTFSPEYGPANANDNNINVLWSAANGDPAPWWQVDLASAFRINHLQLITRQDFNQVSTRRNFEFRGSNDPTFATYQVLAGQGDTALAHAATFSGNSNVATAFRYVRVAKTDGAYFLIPEVRVFGTVPPPVLASPGGLAVAPAGESKLAISWTDNSGEEIGFKLERKTTVAGTYAEIVTLPANATSYQDTGLTAGTQYFYRVRATNGVDHSAYSGEAGGTTGSSDPYAAWTAEYPDFLALPAANRSPSADANGDGISNLIAYALSLNPLAPVPSVALPVVIPEGVAPTTPFFKYRRSKTADVVFEVLVSPDMTAGSWRIQSQSAAMVEAIPGNSTAEMVTVPLDSGEVQQFARLRVIQE